MKRYRVRLGIGALVVAVLVVSAEIYLRVEYGAGHPVLAVRDQNCGYLLKPNQDVIRFGHHHVFINEQGMRSGAVAPKTTGTLRILFVGDSVTYGSTQVDQTEIFSERIHQGLPVVVHRPVQVLNASASAWAIWNEWGYVRSRGIFDSDIVLVVLNSGDLDQPPSTVEDVGEGLVTKQPLFALQEVWDRVILSRLHGPKEDKGLRTDERLPQQEAANLAILNGMNNYVKAKGAKFGIVFVPFRNSISEGELSSTPQPLSEWARKNKVPMLDVTDVLSSHPSREVSLDGNHLTAEGHRFVASDIEQHWNQLFQ
jgi:hypothetical protein